MAPWFPPTIPYQVSSTCYRRKHEYTTHTTDKNSAHRAARQAWHAPDATGVAAPDDTSEFVQFRTTIIPDPCRQKISQQSASHFLREPCDLTVAVRWQSWYLIVHVQTNVKSTAYFRFGGAPLIRYHVHREICTSSDFHTSATYVSLRRTSLSSSALWKVNSCEIKGTSTGRFLTSVYKCLVSLRRSLFISQQQPVTPMSSDEKAVRGISALETAIGPDAG